MKLFGGSSNIPLAKLVADVCGIPLSPVDEHIFPDGERRVRIADNVVGEACVLVQSTSTPVDGHYMELFFLIDGLRRSGASRVIAVIPYFGYQRQDHIFRDGEAVSLEVIINILTILHIDDFISVDMHASRIPDLFPSAITIQHISALPLFAQIIRKKGWDNDSAVLISPDMGGIRRVKQLSEILGNMPWAAIEKNRDLVSGTLSENSLGEGSIENKKTALIVDDMISSGETMVKAAELLRKSAIDKVYAFATHAVFSQEAPKIMENSLIEKVFVTDTVVIPREKHFKKLHILSVSELIAKTVQEVVV